jgi:hypothetical protein
MPKSRAGRQSLLFLHGLVETDKKKRLAQTPHSDRKTAHDGSRG